MSTVKSNERARVIDLISEGRIAGLCDSAGIILSGDDIAKGILLDGTQARADSGALNFPKFGHAFRAGTNSQTAMGGFPSAESETAVATEVVKATPVTRTIPTGDHTSMRVTIRIPGLYKISDSGTYQDTVATIRIEIAVAGSGSWQTAIDSFVGVMSGKNTSEVSESYAFDIPDNTVQWDVRVTRITNDAADPTKLANKTYWDSYTLVTDDQLRYPNSAIVGSEWNAKDFGRVPTRGFRGKGMLVRVPNNYDVVTRDYSGVWDGNFAGCDITLTALAAIGATTLVVSATASDLSEYDLIEIGDVKTYLTADAGSGATSLSVEPLTEAIADASEGYAFILKFTNNPPWILYDIAIEDRYGLGKYIPAAYTDTAILYTMARYCDGVDGSGNYVGVETYSGSGEYEPRFTCSCYIQTKQEAFKVLQDIASTFRALLFWQAGLVTAIQDAPRSVIHQFSNANVRGGLFNYSGTSIKARPNAVYMYYSDPENNYRRTPIYVENRTAIDAEGYREVHRVGFGVASKWQAIRAAKAILLSEGQTVTFGAGVEGAINSVGELNRISDRLKSSDERWSGRLASVNIPGLTVTLDDEVTLGAGPYTIYVQKNDDTPVELTVTNSSGDFTTLNVTGTLTDVEAQGIWILVGGSVTSRDYYTIGKIEKKPNEYEITAIEYDSTKFAIIDTADDFDDTTIGNIGPPSNPDPVPSVDGTLASRDGADGSRAVIEINWQPSPSTNIAFYRVEVSVDSGDWSWFDDRSGLNSSPYVVTGYGDYNFRVTAFNKLGNRSTAVESGVVTVAVLATAISNFSADVDGDSLVVTWDKMEEPTLAGYVVWGSKTDPTPAGDDANIVYIGRETKVILNLEGAISYFTQAAAFDVFSSYARSTQAASVPKAAMSSDHPPEKFMVNGTYSAPDATQVLTVPFGYTFDDPPDQPHYSILNETDTGDNLWILIGIITDVTTTGFEITLNAPTNTANYKIKWFVKGWARSAAIS